MPTLALAHAVVDRVTLIMQPLVALATRLVIGQSFAFGGWGKLTNFERPVKLFTDLGIPFPTANAAFISCLELVGGICLILGLGTRVFAGLLACTMVVAIATAKRADFIAALNVFGPNDLTEITELLFLLFFLWLVAYGAGWLSVDHLLRGRFGRFGCTAHGEGVK